MKKLRKWDSNYWKKKVFQNVILSILGCDSSKAFVGTILIIGMGFYLKSIEMYRVLLAIGLMFFFARYVYRANLIKACKKIHIIGNKIDVSEDQCYRANNLGDITGIIIYLIFIICSYNISSGIFEEFIILHLIYAIVYFLCSYLAVQKNCVFLKIITIVISTMQGIIIMALILMGILFAIQFEFQKFTQINNVVQSISGFFVYITELVLLMAGALELYPAFLIAQMIVSALLYIVVIWMIPYYQLDKLEIAFSIVNIIMVLIGVLSFFQAENIARFICEQKEILLNTLFYEKFVTNIRGGKEYWRTFGTINIKNTFYIMVLPYTFGILVANNAIKRRKSYAKAKVDGIVEQLEQNTTSEECDMELLRKKYYYYGGDMYLFELYRLAFDKDGEK